MMLYMVRDAVAYKKMTDGPSLETTLTSKGQMTCNTLL